MKPTSPNKKHARKSPGVAVIVEQRTDTPPQCVTSPVGVEASAPAGTHQERAAGKVTKEQLWRTTKMLLEQLGEPTEKNGQHLGYCPTPG